MKKIAFTLLAAFILSAPAIFADDSTSDADDYEVKSLELTDFAYTPKTFSYTFELSKFQSGYYTVEVYRCASKTALSNIYDHSILKYLPSEYSELIARRSIYVTAGTTKYIETSIPLYTTTWSYGYYYYFAIVLRNPAGNIIGVQTTKDDADSNSNYVRYNIYVDEDGGSTSGVNAILPDATDVAEYYNLNGQKLSANALRPGVYIVRHGNSANRIILR